MGMICKPHLFSHRFSHRLSFYCISAWACLLALVLPHGVAHGKAIVANGTQVVLQLKWYHQFQFAGYYAAKELGFYEGLGLAVDIREGGPGIRVQNRVITGQADFGILGSELLFLRSKGQDLVALAPIMQHSIRIIIARQDRQIASPHDLKGKKIMLNKNELPEFEAMFVNEGFKIEDLSIINKDKTANEKFINGDIDAINGSLANQPFLFQKAKIPITIIRPIHYGIDFYGDTIFTTADQVKNNIELVDAFLAASFKGWKYAFDHPDELIDIIIKKYQAKKSREHLFFEYTQLRNLIRPDLVEIGHSNPQRWLHIAEVYQKLGMLKPDFSLKGFFYEDYATNATVWIYRLIVILGMVVVISMIIFFWNFQLRRNVLRATREIQESRENLKITLNSIGDAVIATDLTGTVIRMNPVAEKLTGWSFQDAQHRRLSDIFKIVNAKTGKRAENPVEKVLSKGTVVGMANHTALIAKDGTHYQIADSGAPIKDDVGSVIGVVLVFRDMTEEYFLLEKIKEDEKKFRNYIINSPYGIFVIDDQGNYLEINTTFCRMTGYSDTQLLGKNLKQMAIQEEQKSIQVSIEEVSRTGTWAGVNRFLKKDNEKQIWKLDIVKLTPKRFLGFASDITRQKNAEDQVTNLVKFPGENPNPVMRVTPEGIITYANKGSEYLLNHWDTHVNRFIPEPWQGRVTLAMEKNEIIRFEENYFSTFISLAITPVQEMNYVNIYGMDITVQKQVEQALSQSNSYLQTLVWTIPDLVWLKDPQGVYLLCNTRFERFFGAREADIIGKTDYDFVDRELADSFRMHDKIAMDKGRPSLNEEQVTYADDGQHAFLETVKTPMYGGEGQLIGVLGIARDITERIEAEEKRKILEAQLQQSMKMEAVGTIAGGIAHDFNNILGIIIGNAELAVDDIPEWNPVRNYLEEIETAGLRARDVVKQLLNFSRKAEQSKKNIVFQKILKETIQLIRSSIPASIEIQMEIEDVKGTIEADPTQIHQVLINLCTNAAHAMEKEGGTLKIALSEVELDQVTMNQFQDIKPGCYAQVAISDTGHGIDPLVLDKIFDPYFTTKEVGKGTGMGLAVVLGIVRNHNGGISVYSEPDKGTIFKLLFPLTAQRGDPEIERGQPSPTGNERILLIDDEKSMVKMGAQILEKLGYQVHTETDPRTALDLFTLDPSRFDLVITDMTMPHMTGDLLAKRILKISPGTPIILSTGFSSKIDKDRAAKIGIRQYIEKPLNKFQLAKSIREVLGH